MFFHFLQPYPASIVGTWETWERLWLKKKKLDTLYSTFRTDSWHTFHYLKTFQLFLIYFTWHSILRAAIHKYYSNRDWYSITDMLDYTTLTLYEVEIQHTVTFNSPCSLQQLNRKRSDGLFPFLSLFSIFPLCFHVLFNLNPGTLFAQSILISLFLSALLGLVCLQE